MTPDYTQADMDRLIKAAMLRVQAKALREHANSLGSAAVSRSLSKYMRGRYKFAGDLAHDEADSLETKAKWLEKPLTWSSGRSNRSSKRQENEDEQT